MQSSVQVSRSSRSCAGVVTRTNASLGTFPLRTTWAQQLWSVPFTAEVLLQLGERQDVVDAVLARGGRAHGENLSAERVALLLSLPCSCVIQLPPTLPSLLHLAPAWSTASYGMSQEEWSILELSSSFKARSAQLHLLAQLTPYWLQAYAAWASSAIQLDRTGQGQHAPTTVSKTAGTIRRILGFSHKVLQLAGTPGLHDMLNGDMLAAYTSFALDIRFASCSPARPARLHLTVQLQAQQAQLCCHRRERGSAHPRVPAEQAHQRGRARRRRRAAGAPRCAQQQASPTLTALVAGLHAPALQPAARAAVAQALHRRATRGGRVR